jgi:hypothetical protein
MRADEEVGQDAGADAAGSAVPKVSFSSHEEGRNWRAVESDVELYEGILDSSLVGEPDRKLRVDHLVHDDQSLRGLAIQLLGGPVEPRWVLGQNVDEAFVSTMVILSSA